LPFIFCFKRELNQYTPLISTHSLNPPIHPKNALSFASPEKEKYFLFIYKVITWEKILKRATIHYWQRSLTYAVRSFVSIAKNRRYMSESSRSSATGRSSLADRCTRCTACPLRRASFFRPLPERPSEQLRIAFLTRVSNSALPSRVTRPPCADSPPPAHPLLVLLSNVPGRLIPV